MITIVLCLLLTLSLVGCGKNDDESVVVGGDTCPAVCIDGVTYYDTGKAVPGEPDESVIEYVEIPLDGGAVGTVEAFARLEEGKMIVCLINHEWYEFVANCGSNDVPHPEPEAYAFEAQYIRTDGYSEERSYPYHVVINSKEELQAYYEANKELFDLERKEEVYSDTTIGFLDACDKYDDTYFERQNLVLIVLEEGSGSIRHEITDVRNRWDENGAPLGWNITINRIAPEVCTDDMAQWHLFLEVQMGDVIESDNAVWINNELSNANNK